MSELIGVDAADAPKIEFPCAYPIKVFGRQVPAFQPAVLEIFDRHAPDFDRDALVSRGSRNGNFVSLTITITATGPEQLRALHRDLMATGLVQMVL
jgi:putative lipoic acid-binding regulatory protein